MGEIRAHVPPLQLTGADFRAWADWARRQPKCPDGLVGALLNFASVLDGKYAPPMYQEALMLLEESPS